MAKKKAATKKAPADPVADYAKAFAALDKANEALQEMPVTGHSHAKLKIYARDGSVSAIRRELSKLGY